MVDKLIVDFRSLCMRDALTFGDARQLQLLGLKITESLAAASRAPDATEQAAVTDKTDEREACAKTLDMYANNWNVDQNDNIDRAANIIRRDTAFYLAATIRGNGGAEAAAFALSTAYARGFNDARESAVDKTRPANKPPCACAGSYCDCGNVTDAQSVAEWTALNEAAAAMAEHG